MLTVTQYQSWDELQALSERWNVLLSHSQSDTVFLTWEWCAAWWKHYGSGRKLLVVAAWNGNDLVGVAPFYVDQVRLWGKTWQSLRLIGDGSNDSDYLDCFAQWGRESEALTAIARFLEDHQRLWDWIELTSTPSKSPCLAVLAEYAGERKWSVSSEVIPCATLPLPNCWEAYLNSLEPRFRTKVRSALAFIQQHVRSNPIRCSSREQIDRWLPVLFDLHAQRWGTKGRPGVFRDSTKRAFYGDISRAALEQGWLAFHRLDWGERPLALQYGLLYRNRFHLLQEAYDPAFATVRPGIALRAWLMHHWIEAGLEEYDFLAGTAAYKRDWGAQQKLTVRFLLAARHGSRIACIELPRTRTKTREIARQVTPEVLLSLRRQYVSWCARHHWQSKPADGLTEKRSSTRRLARWLAARAYFWTPLGRVGRSMATRYSWDGAARHGLLPVQRRSQPVCQIFLYHRVNDDNDPFLGAIAVDAFRAQMEYLARNIPLLTLDQIARGEWSDGQRYYAAVTFDDGYRDNLVCALPILKRLGIPATIFLTTGYIDSGELPWYDQVRLAFKLTMRSHFSMVDLGAPQGRLDTLAARLRTLEQTLLWLRQLLEPERLEATKELFRTLGVPSGLNLPNQMLKWDEVRQMSKNHSIVFGAHTISHPVLSKISAEDVRSEVLGSKMAIEERLQQPVSHFAYPFGQPVDFNSQVRHSVRDAGFATAVTTIWGLNEPTQDRFELRRFTPWEADSAMFRLKLDWYRFRDIGAADRIRA